MKNTNKIFIQNIVWVVSIIGLAILFYIFPLLSDDLNHGMMGLGWHFMPDVNGRYLGNLLGVNMCNNSIINIILKTLSISSISIIMYYLSGKNKNLLLINLILLITLPKEMFRQVYVFTSGFGNYVIPAIGILYILYYYKNYKKIDSGSIFYVILPILGFCNALFMENITLYNICLGAFLIAVSIKYKKNIIKSILYFLGTLIGTIVMFTNPIYMQSFNGNDSYRSITPIKEIIQKLFLIINDAFCNNKLIIIILMMLSFYLLHTIKITKKDKKKIILNRVITIVNCIFLIYYTLTNVLEMPAIYSLNSIDIINCILAALFFLNLIIIVCMYYKSDIKYTILVYLISYIIILCPLLLVNPIGPRCYYIGYILLILAILEILSHLPEKYIKIINKSQIFLIITLIIIFSIYFNIYIKIYMANNNRINYIKEEIAKGATTVTIDQLPYLDYMNNPYLCDPYNTSVYQAYYNLNIQIISNGCY